ncbi:hypothetical protein CMI47_02080 [Candidatus Pacearchaeota archaeon]|jgi:hypothetical protein|nr:hypothetical protein [Candidatus Pacearchaeota archaeon]
MSIECPADINDDGIVDTQDLLIVISQWGAECNDCEGDINGDGNVDTTDLLLVISNWGPCEEPPTDSSD